MRHLHCSFKQLTVEHDITQLNVVLRRSVCGLGEQMQNRNESFISFGSHDDHLDYNVLVLIRRFSTCFHVHQECRNAWTSMKGRVVFWYRLNTESKKGEVLFKLFGQQCQKCTPGTFEHSMWYPEEVIKVRLSSSFRSLLTYTYNGKIFHYNNIIGLRYGFRTINRE